MPTGKVEVVFGSGSHPLDLAQWDGYTESSDLNQKTKNTLKRVQHIVEDNGDNYLLKTIGSCRGCRLGALCDRCVDEIDDWYMLSLQQIALGEEAECSGWVVGLPACTFLTCDI